MCFFKQKTAYELRISDWSSDVCSSDLTCRATSSAVAPGHSVRIIIALKVNGGSSDWPRRVYETIPAMLSNTMAYTTRPRLRSAHSDSLKRLMVFTHQRVWTRISARLRSEEHTSALQSLMRSSNPVFC